MQADREHARREGIQHDAGLRQDEEQEEDLDEERRRADELDQDRDDKACRRGGEPYRCQDEAEKRRDDEADRRRLDGDDRGPCQHGQDVDGEGPVPHHEAFPCSTPLAAHPSVKRMQIVIVSEIAR